MAVPSVAIIGAGLAGSEAALVLARRDVAVEVFEMRPLCSTPAHRTDLPAELVCSNSLKSDRLPSAHGLLKEELKLLGSPLLKEAYAARVAAGSALAVDRAEFAHSVLSRISSAPNLRFTRRELSSVPPEHEYCIIAAGPLVSNRLATWLQSTFSADALSFYDAIAPIVSSDSIDTGMAFLANRRESSAGDYLNCPFSRQEYEVFYRALMEADSVAARAFEDERFFEACLPIEVVARRGFGALAFGTLKPVGLVDPRSGRRPFAVCQLRRENASGESYGMVGFQTRLTQEAQREVFGLIPGLSHAEFLRYGSIHRNTYLDSPRLLAGNLSFKTRPNCFCAGQLCGNEGYTESIATGHVAALFVLARLLKRTLPPIPATTACGALVRHVTASPKKPFTPSNVNFGLMDALGQTGLKRIGKTEKRALMCERALQDMQGWVREAERCLAS